MKISKTKLDDATLKQLIDLSLIWEKEENVYGYRANRKDDIEGNDIYIAQENGKIIGYLFSHEEKAEKLSSVIPSGSKCFEIMEIYVKKEYRCKGIGKKLFSALEEDSDCDYLILATSSKNYKSILHFYIDEIGMNFHSAMLYKKRNGAD